MVVVTVGTTLITVMIGLVDKKGEGMIISKTVRGLPIKFCFGVVWMLGRLKPRISLPVLCIKGAFDKSSYKKA